MFINLEGINDSMVTIDVRTNREFNKMPLFKYNIELINENEHKRIKKIYPIAFFIIFRAFLKKRKYIKYELLRLSENKEKTLIFGCSRGRLRSPTIYLYAKFLGINCFILKSGIRGFYEKGIKEEGILVKIYKYITFK